MGAVIYFSIYQFVLNLNLNAELLKMLSAVVVLVFLAVPNIKKKYFSAQKPKKVAAKTDAEKTEG